MACYVPTPDMRCSKMASLFDHLVGAREHGRRHVEAKRPGRDEVDDKIELGRLLDREIGGSCALSTKSAARRDAEQQPRCPALRFAQPGLSAKRNPILLRADEVIE
jgi:hypothetical protein